MDSHPTNLFFVAHQDDELLTFGGAILTALAADSSVCVTIMSKGEKSMVKNLLGNGKACPWHEGTHQRALSEDELTCARDAEFFDSCQALGLSRQEILVPKERLSDGSVTPWEALAVMEECYRRHPGAVVHAHSPLGGKSQHRDHQAVGIAALMLRAKHGCKTLFYLDPYLALDRADKTIDHGLTTIDITEGSDLERLKDAADSYRKWNPEAARYAVGYHSVPKYYENLLQHPQFHLHEVDEEQLAEAFSSWNEKAVQARISARLKPKNERINQLEAENAQLRDALQGIESSRSYHLGRTLTAPLRALRKDA